MDGIGRIIIRGLITARGIDLSYYYWAKEHADQGRFSLGTVITPLFGMYYVNFDQNKKCKS
jgi:hypothetical protein